MTARCSVSAASHLLIADHERAARLEDVAREMRVLFGDAGSASTSSTTTLRVLDRLQRLDDGEFLDGLD